MMMSVVRLAFGGAWRSAVAVIKWLCGSMRTARFLYIVLLASSLVQTYRVAQQRSLVTVARAELSAEIEGRAADRRAFAKTIMGYRQAADRAAAEDAQNQARVEAEWRGKLEEAVNVNDQMRARYRGAVAQFVRGEAGASAADSGRGATAAVPGSPAVPGRPVQPPDTAIVPVSDLNLCADAFARAEALITAWRAAAGVAVNGGDNGVVIAVSPILHRGDQPSLPLARRHLEAATFP